ncbi:MAG TPA: DUF4398 domain-containing protein [Polyangiaceae bacterium]|nr:DUF4398 domain-containing protein [Polyangiaceae bacterium]
MRFLLGFVAAASAYLVVGCGSAPPVPADQITQTEAAIRGATEVGAPSVPKAALHLKMAQDQLQTAKGLIAEEENDEARLVLDRARIDAELAVALAKEATLRAQAAEAVEKVKKLRAEAGASTKK